MALASLATIIRLTRVSQHHTIHTIFRQHTLFTKRVFHPCTQETHHNITDLTGLIPTATHSAREQYFRLPRIMAASDKFRLVLPGIDHDGKLPRKYTEEGQGAKRNISPPVEWYNLPSGTKSLALVVQDIDALDPKGPLIPWTNWVVVNIPPGVKSLPEGFSGKEEDQMGGQYGGLKEGNNNDLKVPGWCGPKLSSPGHRFEFKLYALDDELHLGHKVTKEKVLEAIEGHVLGEAVMIAYF